MTSINFPPMVLQAYTACAVTFLPTSLFQAQSLTWDWGGEKKINRSGRELVRMAAAKKPGDTIVSFSDRKLYFVTRPGEAPSYPIAIPREQSRWQGTIAVTSKRENPSWTPRPTMRVENPKLPSWVPGGTLCPCTFFSRSLSLK
jgi:lipoprotein-anchoring transpeptidase ErfK/SrfK